MILLVQMLRTMLFPKINLLQRFIISNFLGMVIQGYSAAFEDYDSIAEGLNKVEVVLDN